MVYWAAAKCMTSILMVGWRVINSNPLYRFRALDVPEGDKYESYTEEENQPLLRIWFTL
jgi:hypothetical protein